MTRFNKFYDSIDLSLLRDLCRTKGVVRTYRRGDVIISEGQVCDKIGLIMSGYFKYCPTRSDHKPAVAGFVFPDEFVADFSNSLTGMPSMMSVVAGRMSEVAEISVDTFRTMCEETGPEYELGIMHVLFRTIYTRFLDMCRFGPKERYIELLRAHPDLLRDVPLHEIASYLHITPIHLSRIRKSLLKG